MNTRRNIIQSDVPPDSDARLVDDFTPALVDVGEHHLCPGCGEPVAIRSIMQAIADLGLSDRTVATFGIGCSTAFSNNLDVEVLQALHGRAPSVATGIKRIRPELCVLTIQGDGDMVNEGLQEVLHTAARGEAVTCFLLNNGVFGETGGHMTATTPIGQRTKTSIDGRTADNHGFPVPIADLLVGLEGSAYVARGAVNDAGNVARTSRMVRRALEVQQDGLGFSFVEILTMCPTGWFVPTQDAPDYLAEVLADVYPVGELKAP